LLITTLFVSISNKLNKDISAATYTNITSQVTVGNSAPSFTSGPYEEWIGPPPYFDSLPSSSSFPTPIGKAITFLLQLQIQTQKVTT